VQVENFHANAASFSAKHRGQYHGAGVFTGLGLRFRHLAQRYLLPFTAVLMKTAWEICKPHLNPHIERMKHRAVKALQMLSPYEKQLLEDHLIEGVTLERLGREQRLDRRTIRKRIKRAIDRLREAEKDLP